MSEQGIRLHFEEENSTWEMDTEKVDGGLVMLGFEEHILDDEKEQVFKTEKILDKYDLLLMKALIDSALSDMR